MRIYTPSQPLYGSPTFSTSIENARPQCSRLIRLDEQQNEGVGRFKGTSITLAQLAAPYGNVTRLDSSDSELFRRAVEGAADLMIASAKKSLTLKSIQATELQQ